MSSLRSAANRINDDFARTALHCLPTTEQFDRFNPLELGRYIVQSGDTLYSIARMYYGPDWLNLWTLIAGANSIKDATLPPPGLSIVIPSPKWRNK